MIRNEEAPKSWEIVDPLDIQYLLTHGKATAGGYVVPDMVTVRTEVDGQAVLLVYAWHVDAAHLRLVAIRCDDEGGRWDGAPPGLPASVARAVAPLRVATEALREVAYHVDHFDPEQTTEATGSVLTAQAATDDALKRMGARKLTRWEAEALARGRGKSVVSVQLRRQRVREVAAGLIAEGVKGRQLYQRVADELEIGRTTVYEHLRGSGLIGKGKKS